MLRNYILVAFRNLVREKVYSLINVVGLAVAVAVCVFVGLIVHLQLNYDHFHSNKDRLYRMLSREVRPKGNSSSGRIRGTILRRL